jgi:hypothetical protein
MYNLILTTNCVWPGDVDVSTQVDYYDVLGLGLNYGLTGAARATVDNSWQSMPSIDWGVIQPLSFVDAKHADCNGDGTIDMNDTLEINLNYNQTHLRKAVDESKKKHGVLSTPDIYFSSSNTLYPAGTWVDVDVNIGTALAMVDNFYGIAFELYFDASLVVPGSMSLVYSNGWIGNPGIDNISLNKVFEPLYIADGALIRTNHTNVDGYGKFVTMRFQAATNIVDTVTMQFELYDAYVIDSIGNNVGINWAPTYTVSLFEVTNGISTYNAQENLTVSPNPSSSSVKISYDLSSASYVSLDVYNVQGEKLESLVNEQQFSGSHSVQLNRTERDYDSGIYFMKLMVNGKMKAVKKIVLTN